MTNEKGLYVLMYHSISKGSGPTAISKTLFQEQMAVLADAGFQTVSLSRIPSWHEGKEPLPGKVVAITFDDGFADFSDVAAPILRTCGFGATVFLPTSHVGKYADWDDAPRPSRPLMSWAEVRDLSREGIEFGGHGAAHKDLTKLSLSQLCEEIRESSAAISERLGYAPVSFAAPYGRANARERAEIRKHYQVSVGTRLRQASQSDDLFDVPRVEMHYFRDLRRWKNLLAGNGRAYFRLRQTLRGLREAVPLV